MSSIIKIIAILLVFVTQSFGATYYIDWVAGNDANNGTSKATPWKRHPYMLSEAVTYTHAAGDRFIFKGGVTWPGSCFTMSVTVGGSGANWDYYGVDRTWYNGGSWTRPIFDSEMTDRSILFIGQIANTYWDALEFINASNSPSIDVVCPSPCVMSNLYIHKWYHYNVEGAHGGIYNNMFGGDTSQTMTNWLITHCDIGNPDGDNNSGVCLRGPGEVAFSKLHDAPELILHGGWSVHDTEFYNPTESFLGDAVQHPNLHYQDAPNSYNGAVWTGPILWYNNYVHDIRGPGMPLLYIEPANAGLLPPTRHIYVYNNVFLNTLSAPLLPDNERNGGANFFDTNLIYIHVFNNTLECTSESTAVIDNRNRGLGSSNFASLTITNNHFINPVSGANYGDSTLFDTITLGNHLKQTLAQANTAGYYRSEFYAPTNAGASIIGAGANLQSTYSFLPGASKDTSMGGLRTPVDRPASGAWDIGAFAFNGEPPPPSGGGYTNTVWNLRVLP